MHRRLIIAVLSLLLIDGRTFAGTDSVAIKRAPWDDGKYANASKSLDHGSLRIKAPFMFRRLGTYFRNGENAPQLQIPDLDRYTGIARTNNPL